MNERYEDLKKRVLGHSQEAYDNLVANESLESFTDGDVLSEIFTWEDSEQGWAYWNNIATCIGEVYEYDDTTDY